MQKIYNPGKMVHDVSAAETDGLRRMLEQAFEGTFVEELIPGILHNFANPLNGIMGRAQILQRRLNDTIVKMNDQCPDAAATFLEPHKKLTSDVAAICQESDRFYNMFQDVSGKFYGISASAPERIDLSSLLASELRFADYYLDFKHEIRKELEMEDTLPEICGIASCYALCFWSLFRNAVVRMKTASEKTLYISLKEEDACVVLRLRYHGLPLTEEDNRMIGQVISSELPLFDDGQAATPFYLSLCLFTRLGAQVSYQERGGLHEIVIRIPY